MLSLLEAIAHREGFYSKDANARPRRNNNPGDLVYCDESRRFGAVHGDPQFAVFPTVEIGWEALRHWLSIPGKIRDGRLVAGYLGASLEQILSRFAPPVENDTLSYIQYVVSTTGLQKETLITATHLYR